MGGSGTRLIVRMLEECGYFMGGAASQNEFAEPAVFYAGINAFTDEFRHKLPLRSDWRSVVDSRNEKIISFCNQHLENYYRQRGYNGGKWGFKDPRSTFTSRIFLKQYPSARLLHVIRNGMDVADSKMRQNWPGLIGADKIEYWLEVWYNVVLAAKSYEDTNPLNYHELKYEDICNFNLQAFQSLEKASGIDGNLLLQTAESMAHKKRIDKVRNKPEIPAHIAELLKKYTYS